nr:CoA-binding protein [Fodinibius sp.]
MLSFFFNPESVAVIGASSNQDKLGHAVVRNLIDCGYAKKGKVYPINPNSSEILGFPVHKSVTDVPDS